MSERLAPSERHLYQHGDQKVYEWDQTLLDVNIYIDAPPGHDFGGRVKTSESFWTLEDGTLHIQLCKAEKGAAWDSALAGHALGGVKRAEEGKRLMLERFQAEHPGFDFSGAEFNGSVPDARTFMGGMPADL